MVEEAEGEGGLTWMPPSTPSDDKLKGVGLKGGTTGPGARAGEEEDDDDDDVLLVVVAGTVRSTSFS